MLPAILAKIGVPVLAAVISGSLRNLDHPAAQSASKALDDLDGVLSSGEISPGQLAEVNHHAEKMAELRLKEYEAALSEINESLRTEVISDDPYVRRMRPTFGYLMALTWTAQMMGVAYILVFRTADAPVVLEAAESLSVIWTVALSVLGIYVYKRSEEKRVRGASR